MLGMGAFIGQVYAQSLEDILLYTAGEPGNERCAG